MTLDSLLKTLNLSLLRPREGIRHVLGWHLSLQDSVLALGLTAVVSAGLISLVVGPMPPEIDPLSAAMLTSPIYLALMQFVGLGMIALFLHLMGRVFGGRGTLPEAVTMMAWMEGLLILLSVVQSVIMFVAPPFGAILVPLGLVISLWLISNYVAELHGFNSLMATLFGVIAAFLAAGVAMIFVFFLAFALGILHVSG